MSNPRTLAVGIDAPSMEGVAIMSSMSSSVNIAQILGRPLRMDPNNRKKQAYIMLPYFVDEMDHATESENTELWFLVRGIAVCGYGSQKSEKKIIGNARRCLRAWIQGTKAKAIAIL